MALQKDRTETSLKDKKPRYTAAEAKAEADRCLYCADAPCIKACPTEIDIPTFIKKIASGNVQGAATTILEQNILGSSCARVCPVEVLCVGDCVYNGWNKPPIQIGRLQRFATETTTETSPAATLLGKKSAAKNKKKVACIGAGPASLAFAATLVLEGHEAVVLEKRPVAGGLNTTGIAPYKLHAHDAVAEVEWVQKLGIEVKTGVEVSTEAKAKELLDAYDAVFLGLGLGVDSKLGIAGEDGPGVIGAVDWIERMKLGTIDVKALGRVLVVGGGNTAIDVAREAALLGAASVAMVYRRGVSDMSGYVHEMNGGRLEGVQLVTHAQPACVVRDGSGKVTALRVTATAGGAQAAGTERDIACDTIVVAIGQAKLGAVAKLFPGVATDARGCVVAEAKTGKTGNAKVFAGGDCVNGGKEVVNGVAEGRDAARHLLTVWG